MGSNVAQPHLGEHGAGVRCPFPPPCRESIQVQGAWRPPAAPPRQGDESQSWHSFSAATSGRRNWKLADCSGATASAHGAPCATGTSRPSRRIATTDHHIGLAARPCLEIGCGAPDTIAPELFQRRAANTLTMVSLIPGISALSASIRASGRQISRASSIALPPCSKFRRNPGQDAGCRCHRAGRSAG